ncbi:MAG: TRAM domain-containing protein [Phycisphaerales bacterium]
MIQFILRGLFLLMTAVVAALYAVTTFGKPGDELKILATMAVPLVVAAALILWDILTPRKKLSAVSGVFLGLIVGMLAAYAMSFLVAYVGILFGSAPKELLQGIQVFLGVICVFGAVSLILQTKDDFRFIIPYVEFAKQIRGPRPMILDTSAIIDGRILDIAQTQILSGLLIVPRFVLNELQTISDSADKLKRARGRRGLDILTKLQNHPLIDVSIEDADVEGATVDQMLLTLADDLHARLLTTDFNLAKIAEVRSVDVININRLAEALRPVLLPGEEMNVQLIKPGESPTQGVGYLEDGTMIVVEHGRPHIGSVVPITVTSVLQTSAGRMIFGRLKN